MAKATKKTYNYNSTVRDMLARHEKQSGEIGIEIECEGRHLPQRGQLEAYWTTHADGSLRGESIEYVMNGPVVRKEVVPALNYLEGLFKLNKTKCKDSYRTSVHVHVNMQAVSIRQTYNVVLMYGILEDILTEYAGTTRVGNLFCLRMADAEFMLQELRQGAVRDDYGHLNSNGLRYAGCNVKSLFDHNSLEFRAFRGTTDMKLIAEWVDIILQIKDSGLSYANPSEMLQDFSNLGAAGFLRKNFKEGLVGLIEGYPHWQDRILAGARLVQDVAYANDWSPMPEKLEKVAPKMAYYEQGQDLNMIIENEMLRGHPAPARPAAGRPFRIAPGMFHPVVEVEPVPAADWPAAMDEEL